jgi:tRNA G18 (ribose-2'-O)-methylase SpoU
MDPIRVALGDPRLSPYRTLRARSAAGEEIAVADGIRVVAALLSLGVRLESMLVDEREVPAAEALLAERGVEIPLLVLPRGAISELIGYRYHGGVMAAVAELPAPASLDELGARIVVLGALDKGENVGAIARSALAFGASGLLLDLAGAGPWQRSAIRASRGAVFGLRVRRASDLAGDLRALGARGVLRIGTAASGGAPLAALAASRSRPWALLLGSEAHGLPERVRAEIDLAVTIPLAPAVESLNVAAAAAIILHALAPEPR